MFSFVIFKAKAQNPNWTVNASEYQYSMTYTAFLNINGTTLSSKEDKVAAFVDGEIRGVSNVEYVTSANKYVAFISVFANTDGETIRFKIYDSTNNTTVEVGATQDFVINGNIGSVSQAHSIASPALNNEAVLNSFQFLGISTVSQTITANKIDIVLPFETDLTNLISEYSVSNGANFFVENKKQISGKTAHDFTDSVIYKLVSESEAALVVYDVDVTLANPNVDRPELVLTAAGNSFVKQAPLEVNVQTNVAITGFTTQDILLLNAVVRSITQHNTFNYTLEVIPIQQGGFSVEIPRNVVFNNENEGNVASNKLSFIYDIVRPYVVSIKRKKPLDEITDADLLAFTVLFSEDVTNVLLSDFASVKDATLTLVKESDSKYTVIIRDIDGHEGIASLNLKLSNSIKDSAGNLLLNAVFKTYQN